VAPNGGCSFYKREHFVECEAGAHSTKSATFRVAFTRTGAQLKMCTAEFRGGTPIGYVKVRKLSWYRTWAAATFMTPNGCYSSKTSPRVGKGIDLQNLHMSAFISHSFDNKPEFDNIVEALVQFGVPYWNPDDVKSGSSLRDQLRQAVECCGVCIFVATHRALGSSWCGAELGAFWGAGKPVIVYLADSSLKDDELPPIVHGDVWERRISRVAARAKELLTEGSAMSGSTSAGRPAQVGNMTIEQFEKLIVSAVSFANAVAKTDGRSATPEEIGLAAKGAAGRSLEVIKATEYVNRSTDSWRKRILWVDDRPDNNVYERHAFESIGIEFTLAMSTREALNLLSKRRFAAIISDMGRKEGPTEGYVLLDAVRANDQKTPFFIYAGSNASAHKKEAIDRGAQGSTNRVQELLDMVVEALQTNALA
jgi:CheY-like chemotaxis protein